MSQFIEWLPQLAVAALPGAINVWLSNAEQTRRFQEFPVFQAWRSPRLWYVRAVQFLLPVILFLWIAPLVFQIPPLCSPDATEVLSTAQEALRRLPNTTELLSTVQEALKSLPGATAKTCQLRPINVALVGNAVAFGWGLIALLNVPISILSAGMVDVGPIYNVFVAQVYEKIYKDQETKMISFWEELEIELAQTPNFSLQGFSTLSECLGVPSYFLGQQNPDHADSLRKLELIRKIIRNYQLSAAQRSQEIVMLLRTEDLVYPQAWPKLVKDFGCREDKIPTLFPKPSTAIRRPRAQP
jgi:hypothetical protein